MKMSRESSNQKEQKDPLYFELELRQKEVETTTSPWDIQERQLFLEELKLHKRFSPITGNQIQKWDANSQ